MPQLPTQPQPPLPLREKEEVESSKRTLERAAEGAESETATLRVTVAKLQKDLFQARAQLELHQAHSPVRATRQPQSP